MLTGDGSTYLFLPGFIIDPIEYLFRNSMGARILVAYATRNGSTADIAQAVGKELTNAGHTADVAEIKTVSTLAGYKAVVLGGPLYMGRK
jgi:flavorubredoxin